MRLPPQSVEEPGPAQRRRDCATGERELEGCSPRRYVELRQWGKLGRVDQGLRRARNLLHRKGNANRGTTDSLMLPRRCTSDGEVPPTPRSSGATSLIGRRERARPQRPVTTWQPEVG